MAETKVDVGCFTAFVEAVSLCTIWPLWLFLIYSVLSATNVDPHTWYAFWAYVFFGIILKIFSIIVTILK